MDTNSEIPKEVPKNERQGECPNCGSENLDFYNLSFAIDSQVYYEFTCNDCNAEGKEWYNLVFTEIVLNDLIINAQD